MKTGNLNLGFRYIFSCFMNIKKRPKKAVFYFWENMA